MPKAEKPTHLRRQYLTPGFHSDVIWLEDQRDYAHVLTGCAEQYLDGCRADDAYGVFLHELTYLKPYLDTHPGEAEFVRALIAAGRVGTGGAHSLPSETILSGEAIVRNLCRGRWYHERVLGDRPSTLMLWDIFGHVSQLPQIAAGARFNAIPWSKDIRGARPLFHHLGLDGTRVLTRRTGYWMHETGTMEGDLEWMRLAAREAESLGHDVDLRLDCVDFRPPRTWPIGRSDYPQPVTVDAILVTPHELWGDLVEGAALADVAARQERLTVPPKGTASWKVELTQGVDAWATVKLAYHGRVGYKQIHLNT